MAAAPASQPDRCPACGVAIDLRPDEYLPRHLCPACGIPRPIVRGTQGATRPEQDPFVAFGFPRRFSIDLALLERRFYEISRGLHPDRFAASGGDARRNSIDRMTFLNEVYRILKDSDVRRDWLLKSLEVQASIPPADPRASRPPADLANAWFELQEVAAEQGPDTARTAFSDFENLLQSRTSEARERVRALEETVDRTLDSGTAPARDSLIQLRKEILSGSYLSSLERDVERLKKRLFFA